MECVRLARTLRELRAATGLSLAALAAKTPYSKSSWERYLNGKALPPRQAVEQLCALAGAPPGRPLALWGLAEAVWRGRAGFEAAGRSRGEMPATAVGATAVGATVASRTAVGAPPPRSPGRGHRLSAGVRNGVLGSLAALVAVVLLAVWGFGGGDGNAGGASSGASRSGVSEAGASAPEPSCTGDTCTGKNPEATRCSSAARPPGTLAERRFGGTVIKVRRSMQCGTVWARIDRGEQGDHVEISVPGIGTQQNEVLDQFDEEGSVSTPMAALGRNALSEVRGCLVRAEKRQCFAADGP